MEPCTRWIQNNYTWFRVPGKFPHTQWICTVLFWPLEKFFSSHLPTCDDAVCTMPTPMLYIVSIQGYSMGMEMEMNCMTGLNNHFTSSSATTKTDTLFASAHNTLEVSVTKVWVHKMFFNVRGYCIGHKGPRAASLPWRSEEVRVWIRHVNKRCKCAHKCDV